MTSAKQIFVMQLGRASRKANRFVRRLPKEAREDVIAAAIAWCWENRDSYSLVVPLDVWFVGAVRDAYKAWARGERLNRAEMVEEMRSHDDPAWNTVLADAVRTLVASMDEIDRKIVQVILDGEDRQEYIAGALELTRQTVAARLRRMRDAIPEGAHHGTILRKAVTPMATESDNIGNDMSSIDKELEKLDMPPEHGKDCPPCWRCKWFDGYLPGVRKDVRMEVVEPAVREAIACTEAEKIRIANEVRDGNL